MKVKLIIALVISLLTSLGRAQDIAADDSPNNFRWTGPQAPSPQDLQDRDSVGLDVAAREQFVSARPDSAWTPSIRNSLGDAYRHRGRISLSLNHWSAVWGQLKDSANPAAQAEANHALAGEAELLSSLGRVDDLRTLLAAAQGRVVGEGNDRRRIETAREACVTMMHQPALSYRCGSLALANIARAQGKPAGIVNPLIEEPSTANGISLARLVQLSRQLGLGLVAVQRTDFARIPLPAVVHWSQNHYGALLEYRADLDCYRVVDPTFRQDHWVATADLDAEASGYFLVPQDRVPAAWPTLSDAQCAGIFGRGFPNNVNDALDKGCKTDPTQPNATCPHCPGMPVWWVSEPYINLWLADEPWSYNTSRGEQAGFRLTIQQRGSITNQFNYTPPGVMHNWYSKIYVQGMSTGVSATNAFSDWTATLYLPGGGEQTYTKSLPYDETSKSRMQPTYGNLSDGTVYIVPGLPLGSTNIMPTTNIWYDNMSGYRVFYPDGTVDRYGLIYWHTNATVGVYECEALLTDRTDPLGDVTQLSYECYASCATANKQFRLTQVTDYDGNATTYAYNTGSPNQLHQITSPYGQTATLTYDGSGNLTNITDAVSLSSSLSWDGQGRVSALVTPYGTNSFSYYDMVFAGEGNFGGHNVVNRAATITDANGGTNLFLYRFDCSSFLAGQYTNAPSGTPLGTLDTGTNTVGTDYGAASFRNSFHWDPRQSAVLSTLNVTNLTAADYLIGRQQHWLADSNALAVVDLVSVAQEPSPDGVTAGQRTFYDYAGKTLNYTQGTNSQVAVTARLQPSGNTEYTWSRYNSSGYVTNQISTYTLADGTVRTRTNNAVYAAQTVSYSTITECPLCTVLQPTITGCPKAPVSISSLLLYTVGAYNIMGANPANVCSNVIENLLQSATNADASASHFAGYSAASSLANPGCNGWDQKITTAYTPPLPARFTNEAGYVTFFTHDGNNRLTSVRRPSGLTTTNRYNGTGFLTNATDLEIARTNSYTYSNGLVSVYQNEQGLRRTNYWDALQRLTGQADALGTVSNTYAKLDLASFKDRLGNVTTFGYDPLRHLVGVTNANQGAALAQYCQCGELNWTRDPLGNYTYFYADLAGRLTNTVYADGYAVTNTFNALDQQVTTADGLGAVTNTYNLQGLLTGVTGGAGLVRSNSFDVMDRLIGVTDANGVLTTNGFDALGRLTRRGWPDGFGETLGWATNGLVANTNRDNEITRYQRGAAGRLLAVTNGFLSAAQQVVRYGYNARDQLTALTDGLGHSNTWQFNQFGWVTNQLDTSNHQIFAYTYDPNGRLTNRWTLGGGNTAYAYDAVGNRTNIAYPSAVNPTPSVTNFFDADNELTNMVDGLGATAFGYTTAGRLASESGPFSTLGDSVSYTYSQGRRSGMTVLSLSSTLNYSYGYDSAWRLKSLGSPAGTFNYGYPASASALVQNIALPNGASITNGYDSLARLSSTALLNYWKFPLDAYSYGRDALGLVTNETRDFGLATNSIAVGYDGINEIASWTAKEAGGTARLNEQDGYGYDLAGNLVTRTNNALVQTFTVDPLNQLTNITRTGTLTVSGATPAPAVSVTVNGVTAQTNADLTFAASGISLVNGNNSFTNIAQNLYGLKVTNTFTVNLPTPVSLQYDANGNLTSDGTRSFFYDAENRLTNVNVTTAWKTEFIYDGLGRRRVERDYAWQSSAWTRTNETRFIFDGLLPIQERDTNNSPLVSYTRGIDLGGGFQSAGGIGGLLARTDANGSTYYHADGVGNITALMDGRENVVDRYLYDPFGRILGQWGTNANTMEFSSMPVVRNLVLYPSRIYDPILSRFISRDPIGALGGVNLYGFVGNSPVNVVDPLGLQGIPSPANFITGFGPGAGESTADYTSRVQAANQQAAAIEVGTLAGMATSAGVVALAPGAVPGLVVAATAGAAGGYVGNGVGNIMDGSSFNQNGGIAAGFGGGLGLAGFGLGAAADALSGNPEAPELPVPPKSQGQDGCPDAATPRKNPITAMPGTKQRGVDPNQLLSGQRNALYQQNLQKQLDLITSGTSRYDIIVVNTEGVIYDGVHGVAAAIQTGNLIDVNVVDIAISPGPPVSRLPIMSGSK